MAGAMTRADFNRVDGLARQVLLGNDRGGYTIPTANLYPFQWNWDSMFAAWGFSTFDLPRAWTEVEMLIEAQWPNGMVPHIVFRNVDNDYFPGPDVWGCDNAPITSSGITQPPVAATIIRKLYERDPDVGKDYLALLLPKLTNWHRWFMQWRLSDQGAVFVTHPWESGRDNAPDWDDAMAHLEPGDIGEYKRRDTSEVDGSMRPTKAQYDRYLYLVQRSRELNWDDQKIAAQPVFRVAEPGMTFILLRANRDLAWLCEASGQDPAVVNEWTVRLEEGCQSLWNDNAGYFDSCNLLTGEWSKALTSASFLSWYAGLAEPKLESTLRQLLSEVPWPIPSLMPEDERFDSLRYWRGPTWGFINAMIGVGLKEQGLNDCAEVLRSRTEQLIADNGFSEYFDPLSGRPAGGESFTWTAAIWLAWVRQEL